MNWNLIAFLFLMLAMGSPLIAWLIYEIWRDWQIKKWVRHEREDWPEY